MHCLPGVQCEVTLVSSLKCKCAYSVKVRDREAAWVSQHTEEKLFHTRWDVQVPEYTWSTSRWISVYTPLIVWRLQQKHSSDSLLSGNCVTGASPAGSSTWLPVRLSACAAPGLEWKTSQTFTSGLEFADKLMLSWGKTDQMNTANWLNELYSKTVHI